MLNSRPAVERGAVFEAWFAGASGGNRLLEARFAAGFTSGRRVRFRPGPRREMTVTPAPGAREGKVALKAR